MADFTRFIPYYIVLSDPALVKQYNDQFPYGYGYAPATGAAVAFNAPWAGSFPGTDPSHVASGTYFGAAPYTWSPEWTSANNYDATVATFQRKSGGFWGLGGTTVRYYWLGTFVLEQPAQPQIAHVTPPAPAAPPARRFIEGFEFGSSLMFNLAQGGGLQYARDAARHVGGMGLALRGPNFKFVYASHDQFGGALQYRTWERFYVRLRQPDPNNTIYFWGTVSETGGHGVHLALTPDARLAVYNGIGGGAVSLIGTGPQLTAWTGASDHHAWHKLDILVRYNPNDVANAIITGRVQVFLDGVSVINLTGITSSGLGVNQHQQRSYLGSLISQTNVMEMDIDDWMVAEWPGAAESAGGPTLTGPDWLQGSKIVAARWNANGAAHANWTGDGRVMLQDPLGTSTNAPTITSAIANAPAEATLDTDQCVDRDDRKVGVLSLMVQSNIVCATFGKLGYKLNGGAAVMTVLTASGLAAAFKSLADGATLGFPAFTSLLARAEKSNDANAATLSYLGAQVELAGTWGLEDYRLTENGAAGTPPFSRFVGQHNAPYPYSVFAKGTPAPPPNSPVVIVSGSYVGNGTGQDITFRTPPCFVCIRNTAGGVPPIWWWSSMNGSHRGDAESVSTYLARVDEDVTFVPGLGVDLQQQRYRMRIVGNDNAVNAIGITYHYVAFCDPGARFALAGEVVHPSSGLTTVDNPLINPNYTPEAMLMLPESLGTAATAAMLFKGLGTTADAVMRMTTTAQLTAALTFAQGKITSQNALHGLNSSLAFPFLLFRRHDGNADPGEPGVLALLSWVGDGTASRTISIAPASGKRPIFAIVAKSDAGSGALRDVAHTTTNSTLDSGGNSTTYITGGSIDALSVGTSLNANGVTYSALVLVGDTTAGNGGFGVDGEFVPVAVAPPVDGPFPTPTIDQVNPPAPAPTPIVGEPDLDTITVLSDTATSLGGLVGGQPCEYYTRHAVNMALSRIGVSKQIVNLSTDQTLEATLARRHVLEDVNQVLRDFDWPFATRYASLVLVGGTATVPVNTDWQYSYRAPNAMMKARRLCNRDGSGRLYDRNPPKFIIGSDATGPLVFTNELTSTAAPLYLEYTVRNVCPLLFGDALFRDACAWKFAFSLAPVLAKDQKKQEFCGAMYLRAIGHATVPAAQESQQAKPGDADWINDREFGAFSRTDDPWNR